MTERIPTIPHDVGLNTCLQEVHITSKGIKTVQVICISQMYEIIYTFNHFHGYENRDEFFDKYDGMGYSIPMLPRANYCHPISYVEAPDFRKRLTAYEQSRINEHTRLWLFVSVSNFVELYANDVPVVEIRTRKNEDDEL